MLLDAFTIVCVSAGIFFLIAGTVGILRFPDSLSRLHALTKADTLGLGLIALGLVPQAASMFMALKILLVWLLVLLGGTAAGPLLARVQIVRAAAEARRRADG